MINFSSVIAYTVKKLWLFLAILLVLFALALSAMRYALPHLEHKKHLIEDLVNEQYGVNLSIESVHAVWLRSGPSIVLNGVTLDKDIASPVALDVSQVYVEIDFWQSISQRMISSNRFELRGVNVDIDIQRIGARDNDFPVLEALRNLFLNQLQSFSLRDGVVSLSHQSEQHVYEVEHLSWQNRGDRHQGSGSARLKGVSANTASFIVDLTETEESIGGVIYAKAEALDISPWVSDLLKTKRPLKQSQANLELWANIDSGTISGITGQFSDSTLEWGSEENILFTAIRGGDFQLLPHQDGWNIRVDQLVLDSNNETLVTDIVGQWYNHGELVLNTVKPIQLNPFLMVLPLVMSEAGEQEFRALNPKGELATLQIQIRDRGVALAAKVIDLSWSQTERIPGMTSLDADVFWYKNSGAVHLHSAQSELLSDRILKQNLALDALNASIFVYPQASNDGKEWQLAINDVMIESDIVDLSAEGLVNLTSGEVTSLLDIAPMPLNTVSQLFPNKYMGKNTNAFLTRAFTGAGDVTRATVLWKGKAGDWPFENNQGIFQAYVDVEQGDFIFSSKWPALSELDLSLRFENNDLIMESDAAQLNDIALKDIVAVIPGMRPNSTLTINASSDGTGEQLAALMAESSLSNSLGRVLNKDVLISGPVAADLQLDIPLHTRKVVASGRARLDNTPIYIASTKMTFEQVSGEIDFINGNITANNLSANLLSQPVSLSFTGEQQDTYGLTIDMQGRWDVTPLASYVSDEFAQYLTGESNWQLDLALSLGKQAYEYQAVLQANLTDVESTLPQPFSSSLSQDLPLIITSKGVNDGSHVNVALGESVTFEGTLPHSTMQFTQSLLSIGEDSVTHTGDGFNIVAQLESADVTQWFDAIGSFTHSKTNKSGEGKRLSLFGLPKHISASTEQLSLGSYSLHNVDLEAEYAFGDWLLDIVAEDARGSILFNRDLYEQGVKIDIDYLSLNKSPELSAITTGNEDTAGLNPTKLPPLSLYCRQCEVFDVELGEVTLDVARADQGMVIRQLRTLSDELEVNATGEWSIVGGQASTQLIGTLVSPDVGQMLKQFGVTSGIKDSQADLNFDLSWERSPMAFSLAKLNGDIEWGLSDGYLTELSDKGSRIFTLFSLNSIVRKLSLDFRDVFAKGFFYDSMSGTLNISDGVAYTGDTEIDGGAGDIEIMGSTVLADGSLNYDVSFTPNVTGNLPVLVYFLATPPTALAALALDQMLTSAKVISNVNYKVTGTISEPVFEEVGRDSKDISLPAQNNTAPPQESTERPLTEEDLQRVNMEVVDG